MGADKTCHQVVVHVAQYQWCLRICATQNRCTFRGAVGDAKHNLSVPLRFLECSGLGRILPGRHCWMESGSRIYIYLEIESEGRAATSEPGRVLWWSFDDLEVEEGAIVLWKLSFANVGSEAANPSEQI